MEQVTSTDGTTIAYTRHGEGEPVLLVHGGPSTAEAWAQVVPPLASRCAVATMDRRGRGASSDATGYSLDREADDVTAVVDALGGRVHLVGHSSGAAVALRAAGRGAELRSLTLYEPPLAMHHLPASLAGRVEELVRAGDLDTAAELFFAEVAATPAEVEMLRSLPPVWERLVASIPTAPRELRALVAAPPGADDAARVDVPVLLLLGELTTVPHFLDGLDELEGALGDVRRRLVPGQRHLANAFAPDALAELVGSFVTAVAAGPEARGRVAP